MLPLHNTVSGFVQHFKTLPKEGSQRGLFATAHMNHAPFLSALKEHPQGPQIHAMLTAHLNSKANAGPKAPMQTIAKSEKEESREVEMPLWKDKAIADSSHAHDLEQRAAMHEFNHKLPKEAAETKAHDEYKREQHLKAAATHFSGMKAAKATGDHDEAKKHHAMYMLHLQQLGLDPMGAVPKEVEHHMSEMKSEPFYRFSPHRADGFLFDAKKDKKKKLAKALPKTHAENEANSKGFLNNPVAQDAYMEGTGAVPQEHTTSNGIGWRRDLHTDVKTNPAAKVNGVSWTGIDTNAGAHEATYQAHAANFQNSRNPATPRKQPIMKPLFDIDAPTVSNQGSPADKQAEADFWQDTDAQSQGRSLAALRSRAKKGTKERPSPATAILDQDPSAKK